MYTEWKSDLFKAHGLDKDKNLSNIIFGAAWEKGHYAGYQEVDNCMYDVIEFAEDVIRANKEDNNK